MITDLAESRRVTTKPENKPENKPRSNLTCSPKRLRNCWHQVLHDVQVNVGLKTGRLPTNLLKKNKNSGSYLSASKLVYL